MSELHSQKPLFQWTFEAYDRHERGLLWYSISGLIVGLMLVYSIATGNFLFGVLIIIGTAVLFLRHVQEPPELVCAIDAQKIALGSSEYPFDSIKLFWIIKNASDEPVLYFQQKQGWHGILSVPVSGQDYEVIREYLRGFIAESAEHKFEPFFDSLFRTLKI